MEKVNYNVNQSVFKVGQKSDKMFLIVKGSVGIFLPTNETKIPNFTLEGNELFGEMGVIENELRSATARCLKDSEIISVTKEEFDERVNNSDVFIKGCLKALSYRLRALNKKSQ
ncbi:cyclic nucleotide-binding domain-containing protein [Alphaproteobacteria bacterium]|jgi:CRP/FNR family cyclic AMP-dependent transcriptional regulator|nr:cyclic nucleotide-binding domain-containing protein [Alphaproteobacteria bacterium]